MKDFFICYRDITHDVITIEKDKKGKCWTSIKYNEIVKIKKGQIFISSKDDEMWNHYNIKQIT